jgi:hypothetical protein
LACNICCSNGLNYVTVCTCLCDISMLRLCYTYGPLWATLCGISISLTDSLLSRGISFTTRAHRALSTTEPANPPKHFGAETTYKSVFRSVRECRTELCLDRFPALQIHECLAALIDQQASTITPLAFYSGRVSYSAGLHSSPHHGQLLFLHSSDSQHKSPQTHTTCLCAPPASQQQLIQRALSLSLSLSPSLSLTLPFPLTCSKTTRQSRLPERESLSQVTQTTWGLQQH